MDIIYRIKLVATQEARMTHNLSKKEYQDEHDSKKTWHQQCADIETSLGVILMPIKTGR